MKSSFGCIALIVLCLVGPVKSNEVQEKAADSLAELAIVSDSLQARLKVAITNNDLEAYRSLIPDDLGIIWPGGQSVTGIDAKHKFDSAFMAIFGGSEISIERQSIVAVAKVKGFVKELCRFEIKVPVDDSTTQTHVGHFTNYWEWKNDSWNWRRIFLTER